MRAAGGVLGVSGYGMSYTTLVVDELLSQAV